MKINKGLITLLLSVTVGIILLWYVFSKYPLDQVTGVFKNVTPLLIISYLVVSFLIMVVFAIRWQVLLRAQGHKGIPFSNLLSYRLIDYGVSYMTPTAKLGGEPVRAALTMRNGITFKEGLTTVTIDKTIELSFTVILFVLGCFTLILSDALSGGVAVFLAMLSFFLLFLNWTFYSRIFQGKPIFISLFRLLYLDKVKFLAKYQNSIIEFEKPIIKFYNEQRRAYFLALGLSIVAFALSMGEFFLLLKMVGITPTLMQTFMVFSVVGMAFLFPVPMGLGSLEALQVWLFATMGLSSAAGVGLAVITRARDLTWVIIAVISAVYFGVLRTVFNEAFNSKYRNPILKTPLYRGGNQEYINIKISKKKDVERSAHYAIMKKKYEMLQKKRKKEMDRMFK